MKEKTALQHIKRARRYKHDWCAEAKEDLEFVAGKQWTQEAKAKHEEAGVNPLTINKIKPKINLLSGIQRQNRTDFRAFPEGDEDSIKSEIVTRLLKNAVKRNSGEYILSEQFETGVKIGEGWVEPVIDYTYDLINGDLKFVQVNPFNVFVDPDSVEYDLSDACFVFKFLPKLTEDKILKLFKNMTKAKLNNIAGKFDVQKINQSVSDSVDYEGEYNRSWEDEGEREEKTWDLTEFEYKKPKKIFIVVDKVQGTTSETDDEEEADIYIEKVNLDALAAGQPEQAIKIERMIDEIWIKSFLGNVEVEDIISPFYPKWKTFKLFPFYADREFIPMDNKELMVQGITRGLKDPQREMNKRRTSVLRHLGSTAHSGWLAHTKAFINKKLVKMFGSSYGAIIEWQGKFKPERITPAPLSQGHEQMAAENTQDMKEISGINDDLLAMNESKSQSGKAIYLRQQQGMVMVQRIMDNHSRTNKRVGKFVVSQLGEIYSVETAIKVCGETFINERFSVPVTEQSEVDGETQAVLGPDGQVETQLDEEAVKNTFNAVLEDSELVNYDVTVGEGANTPTVKYANYMLLMELLKEGVQIPHEVLIEESMLDTGSKSKVKQAISAAQQSAIQ